MELLPGIKDFGFPVAIAAYFIYKDAQRQKEHLSDVRSLTEKAITAIDKSTDAMRQTNDIIKQIGKTIS